MRRRLLIRLRRLRSWEAVNVVFLPALFVTLWLRNGGEPSWRLRIPPLGMMSFLLVQGTLYWHLKLRSVRDREPLPSWFCGAFRTLRACSLAGLALVGAAVAYAAFSGVGAVGDRVWGGGLLAFAALEHVNYYHRQLMHDSAADWSRLIRHGVRRAALAEDLDRTCEGRRSASGDGAVASPRSST